MATLQSHQPRYVNGEDPLLDEHGHYNSEYWAQKLTGDAAVTWNKAIAAYVAGLQPSNRLYYEKYARRYSIKSAINIQPGKNGVDALGSITANIAIYYEA